MDVAHPLGVVTPTLDGDVLMRLALADTAFTTGQIHRLIPDVSVEGIRKVLRRLHRQGVVTATPAGRGVLYALNRDHLAAPAIIALADQAATLRRRLSETVAGWAQPPVYAAIFGSWARGVAAVTSDIDLFLVRAAGAGSDAIWDEQVHALEHAVTAWTGNDARTLVLAEDELMDVAADPVLGSILREGLTVHGSPAWFRAAVVGTSGEPKESDAHDTSRRGDPRRADGEGTAVR